MENLRNRLNNEDWDKSNFISKSSIYLLSLIVLLFLPLYGIYKKETTIIRKNHENNRGI